MNIDIPTAVTPAERDTLQGLARDNHVLEVGALLGYSTVILAEVAKHVVSVDPHEGYPEGDPRPTLGPYLSNLENYGVRDKVTVCVARHSDVFPWLADDAYDLIFIDCTGEYDLTLDVMLFSQRLLKAGGYMCVHDCGHPDWPGAMAAVEDMGHPYTTVDRMAVMHFPVRNPGVVR